MIFGKKPEPPKDNQNKKQDERRQHVRIEKNFILTYFDKDKPAVKHEITQLKNISKGGMSFVTSRAYAPYQEIGIELRTPYLSETTYLEGVILESHEKIKGILYETRLQFKSLNADAEFLLNKLMDYFLNGDDSKHG